MSELNSTSLRGDRIDVQFSDPKFIETLKKWKFYCKSYNGGQTGRLAILINQDVKKLKEEIKKEYESN